LSSIRECPEELPICRRTTGCSRLAGSGLRRRGKDVFLLEYKHANMGGLPAAENSGHQARIDQVWRRRARHAESPYSSSNARTNDSLSFISQTMERLFSEWKIGLQDFIEDGRLSRLFFCPPLLLADAKDDSAEILRGFGLVDTHQGYKERTYALQSRLPRRQATFPDALVLIFLLLLTPPPPLLLLHFSPPRNFMNDPNGMFMDSDGTYHLYYQCL